MRRSIKYGLTTISRLLLGLSSVRQNMILSFIHEHIYCTIWVWIIWNCLTNAYQKAISSIVKPNSFIIWILFTVFLLILICECGTVINLQSTADIELQHLNDTLHITCNIEKWMPAFRILSINRLNYEQKDFEERKICLS